MEIIKTPQRHPNIRKPSGILTIHKAKLNLALKMISIPKSFRKLRHDRPFENTLQHYVCMYVCNIYL